MTPVTIYYQLDEADGVQSMQVQPVFEGEHFAVTPSIYRTEGGDEEEAENLFTVTHKASGRAPHKCLQCLERKEAIAIAATLDCYDCWTNLKDPDAIEGAKEALLDVAKEWLLVPQDFTVERFCPSAV